MGIEEFRSRLKDPARAWVDKLEGRDPLPPLDPSGEWDPQLTAEMTSASIEEIFKEAPNNQELAESFRSGLLIWNDALKHSHDICQDLPSATGSYWHGIMHRREPDFGNSKYWFRKVGSHPAFPALCQSTIRLLQEYGDGYAQTLKSELEVRGWDAFDFVDRCEKAVHGREAPEAIELLEKIQKMEIENLLLWCLNNS